MAQWITMNSGRACWQSAILHFPVARAQLNSFLAGNYMTFFLDFQILRNNFWLPQQEGKSCEPWTKRNCTMINIPKCFLLYNRDPMLQFVLALILTGPFSGLFLKSDPTVPLLSKLNKDRCLSAIGSTWSWQTNNVPFSCVLLTFCLLSSLEGRRCAAWSSPVEGEGDVVLLPVRGLGPTPGDILVSSISQGVRESSQKRCSWSYKLILVSGAPTLRQSCTMHRVIWLIRFF